MTPYPVPRDIPRQSYGRVLARDRRQRRIAAALHAAALVALMLMLAGAALQAFRLGLVVTADLQGLVAFAQSGRAW